MKKPQTIGQTLTLTSSHRGEHNCKICFRMDQVPWFKGIRKKKHQGRNRDILLTRQSEKSIARPK